MHREVRENTKLLNLPKPFGLIEKERPVLEDDFRASMLNGWEKWDAAPKYIILPPRWPNSSKS
jgi:hypothetical protein